MSGDLENMILTVIERWHASRYVEKHGLVTSYDPNKYLAKVTFQPSGQESGWLPIETGHIGQGYGMTFGLQTGQGGMQAGQSAGGTSGGGVGGQGQGQSGDQGDQVVVRYQEGDIESGKVVQRVHSDMDTPPPTQSGEWRVWTKFTKSGGPTPDAGQGGQGGQGQQIYFKNDGSVTKTDGNGATVFLDGKGNITVTSAASGGAGM